MTCFSTLSREPEQHGELKITRMKSCVAERFLVPGMQAHDRNFHLQAQVAFHYVRLSSFASTGPGDFLKNITI